MPWIAKDADGFWSKYESKPEKREDRFDACGHYCEVLDITKQNMLDLTYSVRWDNSLIEVDDNLNAVAKQVKADAVNHPAHYTAGNIEVIDIIESVVGSMALNPVEAALTAQVVKYICRWKNKGGGQDLGKARWYLDRLIGKVST